MVQWLDRLVCNEKVLYVYIYIRIDTTGGKRNGTCTTSYHWTDGMHFFFFKKKVSEYNFISVELKTAFTLITVDTYLPIILLYTFIICRYSKHNMRHNKITKRVFPMIIMNAINLIERAESTWCYLLARYENGLCTHTHTYYNRYLYYIKLFTDPFNGFCALHSGMLVCTVYIIYITYAL